MRNLQTALERYDGKSVQYLGQLQAEFESDPDYVGGLITALTQSRENVANGASWLLLDHLNRGKKLSAEQSEQVAKSVPSLMNWPEQLHCAQMIRHLELDKSLAKIVMREMETLQSHNRPFLRAWSLDAIWHIAQSHDEFKDRAFAAIERAKEDNAASVRARVKNLI